MNGWITGALAWTGAAFVLLAALGVLRMPDMLSRLQAASKAATLGSAFLLGAVAVHFGDPSVLMRAVALGAFLFLTVPIAAHLIARASYLMGTPLSRDTVMDEAWKVYGPEEREGASGDE